MHLERFAFFSLILLALTACGKGEPTPTLAFTSPPLKPTLPPVVTLTPTPPPVVAAWTLMVYMGADNRLEADALVDLKEMEAAGDSRGMVNVVVQVDRHPQASRAEGDWTGTHRYLVRADGDLYHLDSLLLDDLGEVNMGDPTSLSDFITWAARSYPAQRYGLIVWGVGGGWWGVALDETDGGDRLTLTELARALDDALTQAELEQLDLLGFNASLMGQLEVWQALATYARVGVGSEGLMAGKGWNYQVSLAALLARPDMDALTLASQIVRDYGPAYENDVTLSAVDLGRLGAVVEALDELTFTLGDNLAVELEAVEQSRLGLDMPFLEAQRLGVVDLGHWAAWLQEVAHTPAVRAAAKALSSAVQETVVAEVHGPEVSQARGLAIYFPPTGQTFDSGYVTTGLAATTGWDEFLGAYHRGLIRETQPVQPAIGRLCAAKLSFHEPTCLRFAFEDEPPARVYGLVSQLGEAEGNGDRRLEAIERVDAAKGYAIWTAQSPNISDGRIEMPAALWPLDSDPHLYTVGGLYQPADGGEAYRASLLFNRNAGEAVSLWGLAQDGRMPFELSPVSGDVFLLDEFYLDGAGQFRVVQGERLTFGRWPFTVRWLPVPSGDYWIGIWAEDRAGRQVSDYVEVTVASQELDPDWRGYLDPEAGFRLLYPMDWIDLVPFVTDERDNGVTGNRAGDIWLRLAAYSSDQGAPEAAAARIADHQKHYNDLQAIEPQFYTVGGVRGTLIEYDYVDEGTNQVRYGALIALANSGWVYILDMDATDPAFDDAALTFRAIIQSWEFVD